MRPRADDVPSRPAARYHPLVAQGRLAWLLLLAGLPACVEIDPSYADSFTTSSAGSGTTTDASSASGDSTSIPGTCDCGPLELCEAGTCTPARVLYINLDGVTTTFGSPDASQDVQGIFMELAATWDPYGADEATRQQLMTSITEHWAPFRVVVTDTRPPAGPYVMAVVTASPVPASLEGFNLFADPDCGDMIPQDVAFVFVSPGDGAGPVLHAAWVSSVLGRAFGLRFNTSSEDIMGQGTRFVDACQATDDGSCATAHPELCDDDPMQQNSYGELEALLGARG
jgi:hypothetical protein